MSKSKIQLEDSQAKISIHRWLIIITVMMVSTIEVLDSTIVNVSLPAMMSGLSANTEQITWVLTSYIVSAAIFMPLTGFLEALLGRKKLLLVSIAGFLISSVICGITSSLHTMVISRIFQGIFGAALIPLSQSILRNTFSAKEQGTAMAIWGIGIMVTPILGPTIGGFITEHMNWRWIFYLNVPICACSFLLSLWVIKDTKKKNIPIDWVGLILMATALGSLQMFLDKGHQQGWLDSMTIVILLVTSMSTLIVFIIRGVLRPHNIINLNLFRDNNFRTSTLLQGLFCFILFNTLFIQPIMLQSLFNYSATRIGLIMAPRGITCAIFMGMSAMLMKRYQIKTLLFCAISLTAFGNYLMTNYNLHTDLFNLIFPGIFQGIGMGLIFPPLSAASLSTMSGEDTTEATGLYNYGRMLGTSTGLSVISTFLSYEAQINWHRLSSKIHTMNPTFQYWLYVHTGSTATLSPALMKHLSATIYKQASMIAFIDVFWLQTFLSLALLPMSLMLKNIRK